MARQQLYQEQLQTSSTPYTAPSPAGRWVCHRKFNSRKRVQLLARRKSLQQLLSRYGKLAYWEVTRDLLWLTVKLLTFFFFFKQEELREIHAKHYTAGHTGYYEKAPLASEPQHRTPHLSQNPFHTTLVWAKDTQQASFGEITAWVMNRQSWLSPIHFQVTNSSIWSISTELEVGITHENNISHLMFQHMAIASIPKQDSYNSSLITMLFTQQKTHMQFEPQFTKINTTFIKSGATRHMFGKKKAPLKCSSTTRGSFFVAMLSARLLIRTPSCAEDNSPHKPAPQAHFP